MIARRTFIKGASVAAITATASGIHVGQSEAQQVPNSVGAEPPKLKAPTNAADCHMHTYDPAHFPMPPNPRVAPTNATVEDYRLLQKRIGTTRVVIVQPRNSDRTRAGLPSSPRRSRILTSRHFTPVASVAFASVYRTRARARSRPKWSSHYRNASPISAGMCSLTWTAK